MKTIAGFYRKIVVDKVNPEKIKAEVTAFRQTFKKIAFSLDK